VDEEGATVFGATKVVGASGLLPLVFFGPLNVSVGSFRFQQFFLIYAKLMARLRLFRDLESYVMQSYPEGYWIEDSKRIGLELLKKALGFSRTSG